MHENAPLFPLDILTSNCPDHDVGRLHVNPQDAGFPQIERARVYDYGFHLEQVVQHAEVKDCYEFVAERMVSKVGVKECLIASYNEIWQEEFINRDP